MDINSIIQIASVLAAFVALIFIWLQLRQQTKQLKFEALTEVHKEVSTKEFRKALGIIFKEKPYDLTNCESKGVIESIRLAAGLYDLVGVRVQEGVLPKNATLKTEWKILVLLWKYIEGFVLQKGKERNVPYKAHLKWLAAEAETYRIKKGYDFPESEFNDSGGDESVSPKIVYRGKSLHFYGGENSWEYVRRPNTTGGVTIVAITNQNQILLVEQHRVPMNKMVIELPAGLVGDDLNRKNEGFEDAAKRELREETGYDCKKLTYLCEGPVLPGLTDEINALYLAEGLKKIRKKEEGMEVHEVLLTEVMSWLEKQIANGKSVDLKVYSGMFFLKKDRPELFSPEQNDKN